VQELGFADKMHRGYRGGDAPGHAVKFEFLVEVALLAESLLAFLDKFRRLLLRFERISRVHYAFKTLAYTMINLRHYCQI
jgi:hypothetical protein